MAKKKKKLNFYSTDPDMEWFDDEDNEVDTLPSQQQKLRVMRDRKQRKGKEVTLVTGFVGTEEDLKDLGKTLKSKCGVGGSTKDNEIILQGNWVEKVVDLLKNMGYSQTKRVGG
ncbi:translation initiation factor [Aureispira sp. CCB-QB1]|uniref:translation initiation factor n=1 Tax=Aureispira sp. CCB-QB1 TaxID=1313421 RepID=UPI000696CD71|nr:translation initiation factor [Aureispira sp. CCB-QB1]